jgi:hypothetical protein
VEAYSGRPAPSGRGGRRGSSVAGPGAAPPRFAPRRPLSETRRMLSCCRHRLLHVLGPTSPLPTLGPLRLCPRRPMKPLVVFVLGGPGAGKGTQCARIVEVRPGGGGGLPGLGGRRVGCSRHAGRPRSLPRAADYASRRPPRRRVAFRGAESSASRPAAGRCSGLVSAPHFSYILGTGCVSRVGWERVPEGQPLGPARRGQCVAGVRRVSVQERGFGLKGRSASRRPSNSQPSAKPVYPKRCKGRVLLQVSCS